jgi:flagellin
LERGLDRPPFSGMDAGDHFTEETVMASFSVVSNIASANAQANLNTTNVGLQRTLVRLSTGFRINYSGDDAAGLAVANAYRSEVAVLNQGIRNANDGLSGLQIKDGALGNISNLLDRLSTLAAQAASGETTSTSRTTLNSEFADVISEINREATVAGLTGTVTFSVFVSNSGSNGRIGGTINQANSTGLSLAGHVITSDVTAQSAVAAIASAVTLLGTTQSKVGTLQNRLQYAISLAQSQVVNTRAAESHIRDANVAEESANLTRYNILSQSGIATLAQANQQAASVLALLR